MKKLFLIDFILQALVLLPMLTCDIMGIIGRNTGSALAEYIIYGYFLTAPVGIAMTVSSLIWTIKGNTFHKICLPLVAALATLVVYSTIGGGEAISTELFWLSLYATKYIGIAYWLLTFYFYRSSLA